MLCRRRTHSFSLTLLATAVLTSSLLLLISADDSSSDWSYDGDTGPEHWHGACQDKSQSPVDLDLKKSVKVHEPPLKFVNYDKLPEEDSIKNVGSTIKLHATLKEEKRPQITGGGLPGTYQFAQLHFHWGETDITGSEHTIDKTAYAIELHLVHFNTKYGEDLAEAISSGKGAQDTLAVIGVLFRIQLGKPNEKLEPILKAIDEIKDKDSRTDTKVFALQDLLPDNKHSFFRYNGSLTTPGCNEIVVWTVFKDTVPISSPQMERLRSLGENNPNMKHNFRPIQPLNNRTVYMVDASSADVIVGTKATMALALLAMAFSRNLG